MPPALERLDREPYDTHRTEQTFEIGAIMRRCFIVLLVVASIAAAGAATAGAAAASDSTDTAALRATMTDGFCPTGKANAKYRASWCSLITGYAVKKGQARVATVIYNDHEGRMVAKKLCYIVKSQRVVDYVIMLDRSGRALWSCTPSG